MFSPNTHSPFTFNCDITIIHRTAEIFLFLLHSRCAWLLIIAVLAWADFASFDQIPD